MMCVVISRNSSDLLERQIPGEENELAESEGDLGTARQAGGLRRINAERWATYAEGAPADTPTFSRLEGHLRLTLQTGVKQAWQEGFRRALR